MRRRWPATAVFLLVVGCGAAKSSGDAASNHDAPLREGSVPDAAGLDDRAGEVSAPGLTVDAAPGDGGFAPDAAADDGSSAADAQVFGPDGAACFIEGYRVCCGLPGELVGSNCSPRQSIEQNLAHCLVAGAAFDLKDRSVGVHCCAGLVGASATAPLPGGGCTQPPVSLAECLPCGDGVCQDSENRCNCARDCH